LAIEILLGEDELFLFLLLVFGNILEERLRYQFRTQLDIWQQIACIEYLFLRKPGPMGMMFGGGNQWVVQGHR
jgi:hypothetical protein